LSIPLAQNKSATLRKSFFSYLLSLLSVFPEFADHYVLLAHNGNMIGNSQCSSFLGCGLRPSAQRRPASPSAEKNETVFYTPLPDRYDKQMIMNHISKDLRQISTDFVAFIANLSFSAFPSPPSKRQPA
jgi:hypothetical protein